MKLISAAAATLSLLLGCAAPTSYTAKQLTPYDKDTDYAVEDAPGGFAITVYYSRYQFFPESSALLPACKSQLTSIAHEVADKRGKKLQVIDEQRIKVSMGRNGFTGITSCSATVAAQYVL